MTLQDRINSALADHLAEHGGGMVSAFHLAVEYVDAEGDEGWAFATAPDQRLVARTPPPRAAPLPRRAQR